MEHFDRIYQVYFRDVYLYLCALTHDKHIAEELASEAFFRAMRNINHFRGECDMRVWLCQIAKNCYFDHLRSQKKLVRLDEIPDPESCAQGLNPDMLIERRSDVMQIHRHLHSLPEPYKEVFSLRVFGELGFKEIGALFGRSANWACVVYHRARARIQQKMEEEQ